MVGKTFKSKINGKVFKVEGLHTENVIRDIRFSQCYKVRELASGKLLTVDKRVFEEMCLANLEIIEGGDYNE